MKLLLIAVTSFCIAPVLCKSTFYSVSFGSDQSNTNSGGSVVAVSTSSTSTLGDDDGETEGFQETKTATFGGATATSGSAAGGASAQSWNKVDSGAGGEQASTSFGKGGSWSFSKTGTSSPKTGGAGRVFSGWPSAGASTGGTATAFSAGSQPEGWWFGRPYGEFGRSQTASSSYGGSKASGNLGQSHAWGSESSSRPSFGERGWIGGLSKSKFQNGAYPQVGRKSGAQETISGEAESTSGVSSFEINNKLNGRPWGYRLNS